MTADARVVEPMTTTPEEIIARAIAASMMEGDPEPDPEGNGWRVWEKDARAAIAALSAAGLVIVPQSPAGLAAQRNAAAAPVQARPKEERGEQTKSPPG